MPQQQLTMRAFAGVVVVLSVIGAAQALDASAIFPELLSCEYTALPVTYRLA